MVGPQCTGRKIGGDKFGQVRRSWLRKATEYGNWNLLKDYGKPVKRFWLWTLGI